MALVDTQGFVMAVDRSLFGPQGRRWIERKLPDVVTNLAFIGVSAIGALFLVFHITREYYQSGYWAILHTPKHVLNAVILHLVARALRWHIDRLLGVNFAARDEALPDFFQAGPGGGDANSNDNKAVWPWQSSQSQSRTSQQKPREGRSDSAESATDQERQGWWGGGGGGGGGNSGRRHRRTRSAGPGPAPGEGGDRPTGGQETAAAAAAAGAVAGARAAATQEKGAPRANVCGGVGGMASSCMPASQEAGECGQGQRRSVQDGLAGAGGSGSGHDEDDYYRDDTDDNGDHEDHHHAFLDLFGACRPGHNNRRRRGDRDGGSPASPPASPVATRETRAEPLSLDRTRARTGRRHSLEAPRTAAHRWVHDEGEEDHEEAGGGGFGSDERGRERGREGGGGGTWAVRDGGWTSDDGGAGGHGAGSRGSIRRLRGLRVSPASSPPLTGLGSASSPASLTAATAVMTRKEEGEDQRRPPRRREDGTQEGEEHQEREGREGERGSGGMAMTMASAVVTAATATATAAGITGGGGGGGDGGSRRWKPIDKLSRALTSSRGRKFRQGGGMAGEALAGSEQKLNFFTEADLDELMHSTFFIKMCDDASWLFVEDHPYVPELNWLLTLWGGYKIAPRFQGEVKQNEAHRMLFQCESGRHRGNIRIRSRATNTFLFFLGVKQPLTWVAWDRDVVGGDWEDLKLEWVGKPGGPDGVLVGDERGRVVIRSRRINGYVSWNGSRFTHVPAREGATVFMLQRMAAPISAASSGSASSAGTASRRRRTSRTDGEGRGSGGGGGGVGTISNKGGRSWDR